MNKYEISFTREVNAMVLEKRFNVHQVKRLKSDCTFKIDTKAYGKNSGIYLNILKMKLRRVKLTGVCIDSITVKYNDDTKKRFCGELNEGEIKSIEDHKGKVKITISIDRSYAFTDPEDYLEFQIVATAYKGKSESDLPRKLIYHHKFHSRLLRLRSRVSMQEERQTQLHQQWFRQRLSRQLPRALLQRREEWMSNIVTALQ